MAARMSEEELRDRAGEDVVVFVRELRTQVETHKARADAAVINAEQACSLIEQKYLSLTEQFGQLEHEKQQSVATMERRSGELAQAQGKAHKLELDAIKQYSELERVSFDLGEVRKSKRDLLDVVEQKNSELEEKNSSIKSYLDKIVSLTDERSILEGKLREHDAESMRSRSVQARLQQEKELLEQHNAWLNEELTSKVKGLMDERDSSAQLEADLQSKLNQAERLAKGTNEALQRSKERVGDLEAKLAQTREELRFAKEQALLQEENLTAEVTTATKLADLYKESSDDWSSKSNELEGVIKAIETHLNQVEADYRDKLNKEIQTRDNALKEAADLKVKIEELLADRVSKAEKNSDFFKLPAPPREIASKPMSEQLSVELHGEGLQLPSAASGISGTALAAALLRDGWSLSKVYSKYQEAVDAWRHETHERKNVQSLLERVLHEIELKAEVILDERVEHGRMIDAYRKMEEKLHFSMADQNVLENSIKELKADLRKKEREVKGAQKEISDLQIQVAGLLKEYAEVNEKHETGGWRQNGDALAYSVSPEPDDSPADVVISEKLVSFKDIKGMVEQNSQLRILVRDLAQESEQKETELKEFYSAELNRRTESAATKVSEVMQQFKEREEVIGALQGTVAMYKRLYEEELKSRFTSNGQLALGLHLATSGDEGKDYGRLLQSSQEEIQSVRNEAAARVKALEEELAKTKTELTNARIERAGVDAAGAIAREQMLSLTLEAENRRKEMDSVLSRNMEFSQTITNYQQQLRESSQRLHASEERMSQFKVEVSILEKEKELIASAEKRASEEVAVLSDRSHRLQASLDAFRSSEETRESARAAELKKLQENWSYMQKEWTEARRELEVERRHSRDLTVSRDKAVEEAMTRVEVVNKELADALKAMSAAETRAQVAELRCTEVEANLKKADDKIVMALTGGKRPDLGEKTSAEVDAEILSNLQLAREELDQVKEDLVAARGHTDQYKLIAAANEEALKQLEAAHNQYKDDVDHTKEVMEAEIERYKQRIVAFESDMSAREMELKAKNEEKEEALISARKDIANLDGALLASKISLQEDEVKIKTLKEEVDKYHHQWRDAQRNYERQILLQADTIRELTAASDRLSKLEEEEASLKIQAETAESQLASLQVAWAMEKSSLESMMTDSEKNRKDLEQQNRVLLDRLEAVHVTALERGQNASLETESNASATDKPENDLQTVIRYLRRSKETAETEVSLLKQERLRLQRQLDAALRAAEEAQSRLRHEQENARANLYSDEEIKSLQAQVREINLMRESNAQLREENRSNFEDSRASREKARQAQAELEPVQQLLKERDLELEAARKDLEMQRAETQRWMDRVSQLLERYRAIDVEDYQHVKTELTELQELLKLRQEELEVSNRQKDASKTELETIKETLEKLQNKVTEKERNVNELERKVQDSVQGESATKAELERFKRHAQFQKRKLDNLTKEKDDLSRENEALSRQAEEHRSTAGKRVSVEARQEAARQEAAIRQEAARQEAAIRQEAARQEAAIRQEAAARLEQAQKESESTLKEREARIQLLEKTVEKEREILRKEKLSRTRDQKTFYDVAQKAVQEKKRFLDELATLKREKAEQLEKLGNENVDTDSSTKLEIDERAATYSAAVNVVSERSASVMEQIGHVNPAAPGAPVLPSLPAAQSVPAAPAEPLVQSISENLAEAVQSISPDISAVTSESQVGGSAPTSGGTLVHASSAGAAVASAIGPGIVVGIPISTALAVSSVSATATAAPRLPVRPAATTALPLATRPPFRPPAQPVAVPDQREREMAQLRAQILEKEKSQAQAGVSQTRKTTRRIIRPRIEPDVATELGEIVPEGTTYVTEAEMEQEEAKLSTVTSDVAEFLSSTPQLTVVSSSAITVDSTTAPSVSISISAGSSPQPLSGLRKRPAVTAEPVTTEEVLADIPPKAEGAPPQKRPRGVESLPEESVQDTAPSIIAAVLGTKLQGESKFPETGADEQAGQHLPAFNTNTIAAPAQDFGTATTSSETDHDQLTAEPMDIPPLKRPRVTRLKSPSPPLPVAVREESMLIERTEDEKSVPESDNLDHDTDNNKDTKMETEILEMGTFTVELSSQEQKVEVVEPSSSGEPARGSEGIVGSTPVAENAEADTVDPVVRFLNTSDVMEFTRSGPETSGNEMLIETHIVSQEMSVLIGQPTDGTEKTDALPVVSEVDVSVGEAGGVQREVGMNAELPRAEDPQEAADEQEEGEIAADVTGETAESGPSHELGAADQAATAVEPETSADVGEGTTVQGGVLSTPSSTEQHQVDTSIVENPEGAGGDAAQAVDEAKETVVSEAASDITTTTTAAGAQDQIGLEETVQGETSTQPSVRSTNAPSSTTIHLADRAQERAVLRRSSANPQSPSTRAQSQATRGRGRGTRGRRAPSASRGGRVISTGIRGRGQAGGRQSGRGAAQGGSGGAGQADQPDGSSSNPYDTHSREGET